jgi:hypothetical protein
MAATINLRAFPEPKQVDCPHCQRQITLLDPDGSEFMVCVFCHSYNRLLATNYWQTQQPVSPIKYEPIIPVGTQGTLRDTPYKVIGYMEKKESASQYAWREYMLYSHTKGYAFLAEYEANWSFIAGKQHFPQLANASEFDSFNATMDGVEYKLFNKYAPVITALIGEFDWDVYEERITTSEFIHPPYLLVEETDKKNKRAVDWYLGEYIEHEEIAAGFNIPIDNFPDAEEVAANEPNPYLKRWVHSVWISIVAAVLLIAMQIALVSLRPENVIIDKEVEIALPPAPAAPIDSTKRDTAKTDSLRQDSILRAAAGSTVTGGNFEYKSLRTSSFTINGPAPVEIDLSAPIDNTWFQATVELVNEKDNQTWDVSRQVEYYHGYEDGENWTEGGTSESALLNDVPKGTYHLNIYPYAGSGTLGHMNIKVEANVVLWQNILITLLLLCIYPIYCWYLKRKFEVNRWMGNYYSPYKTSSSDD